MRYKLTEGLDFEGALDNLAALASIDLQSPPPLGVMKKNRLVTHEEALTEGGVQWLSGEGAGPILELLDLTYHVVLEEFHHIAELEWEHRERVAAAMALVGEAAKKLNRYLEYRLNHPLDQKVEDRPSYKMLQEFYKEKFLGEDALFALPQGTGFKDFESIKADKEYELFYIRNEEGEPYFDPEILRKIKLTVDFESEEETFEEDPLLKVRAMFDRDLHAAAGQILQMCEGAIAEFYQTYKKVQDNDLAKNLSAAILALFLANNPRYLLQNTTGKSCLDYYKDFLLFLRASMHTTEYQKLIAYPPDKSNKIQTHLLHLVHLLSKAFFIHKEGVRQEAIGLIHRSSRKGGEKTKDLGVADTVWNQFLLEDEKLRTCLSQFPNGPLFKILDLIRLQQDEDTHLFFDPIGQENFPSQLFSFVLQKKRIELYHIPCPTKQAFIHKAEIVDEFRGFLRSLDKEKRHLLVNLQDRDSWKEGVRCRILESLQKRVEFASQFSSITLPKDTDFYHQRGMYEEMNEASHFLQRFTSLLQAPEENGFFLPQLGKSVDWQGFLEALYRGYFAEEKQLTKGQRQNFIEIAYQWIVLLALVEFKADSLSFTCKDAIDTGAAETGVFFGFLQLMNGDFSKKETQDFLKFLLYTPALFLRERIIDAERLNRTLSALYEMDKALAERGKIILKEMTPFCQGLNSIQMGSC